MENIAAIYQQLALITPVTEESQVPKPASDFSSFFLEGKAVPLELD